MRICALAPAPRAGTAVTTAGTMSPARRGCDQRGIVKPAMSCPSATTFRGAPTIPAAPFIDGAAARDRSPCSPPSAGPRRASSARASRLGRAHRRRTSARASCELLRRSTVRSIDRAWAVLAAPGDARRHPGVLLRDEAFVDHPRQHVVVAPRQRLVRVHKRAQPSRGLHDCRERRGLVEGEILRGLVEVEACARFDAIRAVPHRHVVGVEGEDLALRVSLFELDGDDGFLDLALEPANARSLEHAALHVILQEQHSRDLLGNRAGARPLAVDDVVDRR